jgi:hypothetical protein
MMLKYLVPSVITCFIYYSDSLDTSLVLKAYDLCVYTLPYLLFKPEKCQRQFQWLYEASSVQMLQATFSVMYEHQRR